MIEFIADWAMWIYLVLLYVLLSVGISSGWF